MGIDFLESEKPKKAKERKEPAEYHIPQDPIIKRKPMKEKLKEKREERAEEKVAKVVKKKHRVNLVHSFSLSVAKRRLLFISLFAIIVILIGGGVYIGYIFLQAGPVEPAQVVTPARVSEPAPVVSPTPVQEEKTMEEGMPSPLPDTPLAPLRGSLVRFSGNPIIYLVEENGELRKVNLQTVVFDNGQRISEIDLSLIYLIDTKWETVRKGKDVTNQVDWDPRVLLPGELDPFL